MCVTLPCQSEVQRGEEPKDLGQNFPCMMKERNGAVEVAENAHVLKLGVGWVGKTQYQLVQFFNYALTEFLALLSKKEEPWKEHKAFLSRTRKL